ncbi:c-type cytochrome domain-containing protein [Pelagicoccus mobilis]|uniref:Cytochrome C Planctomycete-type domain-containing protein n=1 Tax=Pelagicoccus mobilis TaxID=415221 RepID=A0A934VMR9_9BACT|nr:c-type cytochrome domain-containing protein [Pelagicoccus mobilis]MBK1879126.1 hypothetical protein [Pelagicoccus mobilis]
MLAVLGVASLHANGTVNFHEEVFPIFEDKCFRCHSSQKQKGDLRLDSPIWIMQGGENGDVVIPGDPDESPVYYMTTYPEDDPDYMPSKGDGLTEAEQELLRRWIAEGANFGDVMGGSMMDSAVAESVSSKYTDELPLPPASYEYSVSVVGIVHSLEELGLRVDTVNHDAELFELTYTYADEREAYALRKLDPIASSVVKLNYGRSKVRDQDLIGINGFEALSYVDLRRTRITDEALAHFEGLESLEYLNLFETDVSDAGLKSLRSFAGLKQLYVRGTQVTTAGIRSLQKAIPDLKIVH